MFSSPLHPLTVGACVPSCSLTQACLTGPVPTDPLGCFHWFPVFFFVLLDSKSIT